MDAHRLVVPALCIALALCGCRRSADPVATQATGAMPAASSTQGAETTSVAPILEPATRLAIAEGDGVGSHLVDGHGRAVYAFSEDVGASTCVDACLKRWPPLAIPADQQADVVAPVDAVLAGKLERDDGIVQATYAKHPLYLYTGDATPGQHAGHDLTDEFGHWSLVAPDGKPIALK
jgi:predicted lipoprotein with Yx(FWY)xxD motif